MNLRMVTLAVPGEELNLWWELRKTKGDCLILTVEELNQFYVRFDSHNFSDKLAEFRVASEGSQIVTDEFEVMRTLEHTNGKKSHRPDYISGPLLKNCAPFLSGISTFIFQLSLSLEKVPMLWKESIVVPVAKVLSPKTLINYRPVAL